MDIELSPEELRQRAVDKLATYLSARDHSEKEIRDKLSRRFDSTAVDWAIHRAWEYGWFLPPNELAQKVARHLDQKNKSYYYISNYLQQKDLPPVDKNQETEINKAHQVLAKKFGSQTQINHESKPKIWQYLRTRGFDGTTIRQTIDELANQVISQA